MENKEKEFEEEMCDGNCETCSHSDNCDGNCENCTSHSSCNGDCEHCSSSCSSNKNTNFKLNLNQFSHIKKIIGVVSGKGGVGKSMISSLLAVSLAQRGLSVGIMDADITGPSIGRTFGVKEKAYGQNNLIYPFVTKEYSIKVMSANMMLPNEDDPIIWRGSLIANLVQQFYSDVLWGKLDVLVIDMPPGTGDVALTTFQSIPLDGIVMVTTPQDLVSMIVTKALKMAEMMKINVLGVVENMAYVECPCCNEKIYMYGESKTQNLVKPFALDVLASLPINSSLTQLVNEGRIEEYKGDYLQKLVDLIVDGIDLGEGD